MTESSALPKDVDQLLRRRIRSLTQLETLLLLRAAPRTAADVSRELRISEVHAEDELLSLVAMRVAKLDDSSYSYAPTPKTRATIDALAALYPTYRVAISAAIFSRVDTRTRSFSDAFRLRNDGDS